MKVIIFVCLMLCYSCAKKPVINIIGTWNLDTINYGYRNELGTFLTTSNIYTIDSAYIDNRFCRGTYTHLKANVIHFNNVNYEILIRDNRMLWVSLTRYPDSLKFRKIK